MELCVDLNPPLESIFLRVRRGDPPSVLSLDLCRRQDKGEVAVPPVLSLDRNHSKTPTRVSKNPSRPRKTRSQTP